MRWGRADTQVIARVSDITSRWVNFSVTEPGSGFWFVSGSQMPCPERRVIVTISLTPSQTTSISNYLVTSSLLKDTFGTANAQLQTIDSYLTGTTAATSSTTGDSTGSSSSTSGSSTSNSNSTSGVASTGNDTTSGSIAATSNAEASSLLGSFLDTLI